VEDLGPQIVETAAAIARERGGLDDKERDGATGESDRGAAHGADERRVIAALARTRGRDVEAIGRATGLAPAALHTALLGLELRGIVVTGPGPRYFLRAAPERSG
jgi:predicted Rossmann fold nucleotide-binding protein DprA/Smf involved in DNA uptake